MTAEELFSGYKGSISWDEMVGTGDLREPYRKFMQAIGHLTTDNLNQKDLQAGELFMNQGITFTVYSDDAGIERIFPFDILPRIITGAE